MLEIKTEKGLGKITAKGNVPEILSEISSAIGRIYGLYLSNNAENAEFFKTAFITVVNEPDSPIWNPLEDEMQGIIIDLNGGESR